MVTENIVHSTILLIEDEEHIRKLVSTVLTKAGYTVVMGTNGVDALARLEESTPDLIISDIMMPDMDGLSLLKELRSRPSTRGIPLIFVTAMSSTQDLVNGLSLGADDYLVKPFQISELLARVRSKIERPPVPSDMLVHNTQTGLLAEKLFLDEVRRELARVRRGGANGCLAYLAISELSLLEQRLGSRARAEIFKPLADMLTMGIRPLDLAGHDGGELVGLLLPDITQAEAELQLNELATQIAGATFGAAGEILRLTPVFGFAMLKNAADLDQLRDQALTALQVSATHLDLHPRMYLPSMGSAAAERRQLGGAGRESWLRRWQRRLNLPVQIGLTLVLGWLLPFLVYFLLDHWGYDISHFMYLVVVAALLLTAFFIWVEGLLALQIVNPPDEPASAYPAASAIVAAYLPNEAATLVETMEAFLRIEYPAALQIILAYNTPYDMPVEATLREMAGRDPRLLLLRIPNSNSKAQNVNAALSEVHGEFVGIYDADHHPDPGSFMRAWRWLSRGYDVVQGHCVVRNGASSWVSRLIAVEFEAIYAISHPGRMRLHNFGIFGGSNGFWKTDLLRKTRMLGFMLTEDIDSSIRSTEAGARIISDPLLVSRELAPTSVRMLWNQRMRWAQGWYQVSLKHLWAGLRSPLLSARQKFGLFWLLGWREIYPWLSIQMFPLITFWVVKYQGVTQLDWLIPIFVLTSLFTLSVAPGQVLFAYLVSVPEIRKHRGWYLFYLVISSLFYTEFKNVIARVAQIKELMRERQWKITPRSQPNRSSTS